ncbi:MAG: SelB C-terminal domain-containing protein, partial [Chloroflexi bacterium]|nr:SelB C-terminal domain-containing protein [Chloroflexota bacterium]
EQQHRMDEYVRALAAEPFRTEQPSVPAELLALLVDQQRVVRATDTVAFDAETYDGLRKRVTDHLREHGKVTVAEVRDMFGTSRKYALAVLEHLDEEHVTRRVGDERVLLQG